MVRLRMMVAALGVVMMAACGDSSGGQPGSEGPASDALDVVGTLVLDTTSLTGGSLEELMAGTKPCAGSGGYDDIREGAQVTVTDEKGATVGLGSLGPGRYTDTGCVFRFTVKQVAKGHPFYGVEVSHRGVVRFDPEKVKSPNLTLG